MAILRAAIYARKSNDDNGKTLDNKSITRQIENATAYAESKGFTVNPEHVFHDDGVSGAEFVKRPGLHELIKNTEEFDVVIMSELSRMGRDADRTALYLIDLYESGKRIFYYLTDEEEKLDNATSKFMLKVKAYTSEIEREKASQRVADTLYRKARAGHVTGRPVFGYDHVPVESISASGELVKSHSEYAINKVETDIIVNIFKMYQDGIGYKKIAKTLNGDTTSNHTELLAKYFDGIPPKRAKSKGNFWSEMQIRSMLRNDRYTGKITYGKKKSRYVGGSKITELSDEYIEIDRPDLRIVPDDIWGKVQSRIKTMAKRYSDSRGGNVPFAGSVLEAGDSQFLLSGLCICSECGSSLVSLGGSTGTGPSRKNKYKYGCSGYHNKGTTVCSNNHSVDLNQLDQVIIENVMSNFLSSSSTYYVISKALEIIQAKKKDSPSIKSKLISEESAITKDIDKLLKVILEGAVSVQLSSMINQKEERKIHLQSEINRYTEIEANKKQDIGTIQDKLFNRVADFRDLVTSNVADARKAIKHLLAEKIIMRPTFKNGVKTLSYEAKTHAGRLMEPIEEDDHIGLVCS